MIAKIKSIVERTSLWSFPALAWHAGLAHGRETEIGAVPDAAASSNSLLDPEQLPYQLLLVVVVLLLLFSLYRVSRLRREVEEQRLIRNTLQGRERQLHEACSLAGVGHWQVDLETGKLSGSDEAFRIFGFSPGTEPLMDDFVSLIHDQDRERVVCAWDAALQQGSFDVEHRVVVEDKVRWVRQLAEIRFDDRGKAVRALGSVQDVTDMRRAESAYHKTSSFTRAVTDAVGEGLFVLDRARRCVFANPECGRLLGWREEELLGRDLHRLVHVESEYDRTEQACPVLDSLQNGRRHVSEEERFRRKDDSQIAVRVVTVPLKEEGAISGVVVAFQDISERKRMETRLRASEERLSRLLESVPDAILVSDPRGVITMVNQQTERMFGYSREELLGRSMEMLLPEQLRTRYSQFLDHYVKQSSSGEEPPLISGRELSGLTRDGVRIPLEITLNPMDTPRGLSLVSAMRDISQRKQAEEQIRKLSLAVEESHSNIAQRAARAAVRAITSRAVEQSHSTIVITNLDGKIEFVNPAFTRITGYTQEEVIGNNPRMLQSGEHDADFYREMWTTLLQGDVWRGELHNKRKDGSLYWEYASISPVKNEAGEVTHYVAIKEDITERREAQEKLLESERRMHALIESLPDPVFFKDGEGRWRIVNSAGLRLFDLLDKPWQGRKEMELAELQPEYLEAHEACLASDEAAWEKHAPARGEEIIVDREGRSRLLDVTKIPLFADNGRRKALVVLGRDITEQKSFQEQLQQAKEQAESASRAKSAFLANMSHELRTPMNAVLGFASLLQESEQNTDNRRYLDAIQTAGRTLMLLIDDILDLSKIEAGRLDLQYRPVELQVLLHELETMLSHRTAEKELELWVEMDEAAAGATLLLDEVRLRQILLNLIGNAVKFTERGHVGVRVSLEPVGAGHLKLNIAVEDTGIGIPADQQTEIFDLFTQSKGQDMARYGGTGLGLAISRSLARLMGGDIRLESEAGKGSVFTLVLPRVEEQRRRQVYTMDGNGGSVTFAPAEILIVDDVLANRLLLRGFLGNYGFTLREAGNGEEALEEVRKKHPDLILMDVLMPVLGGLEAARRLKEDPATADIPIIAVTASVTGERKSESESTCEGYLSKPVSREALVESLLPHLPHIRRRANS